MKTIKFILVITLIGILFGCSSGGDMNESPDPNPDPEPSSVTYNGNIKSITSNCTTCHSNPPTNNAPMSLTTYDDVKNAVENRGLISRINSSTNPMPPTGLISQSSRDLVQAWVNQGFLVN